MSIDFDLSTPVIQLTQAEKDWLAQMVRTGQVSMHNCGNVHLLAQAIERGELPELLATIVAHRAQNV